MLEAEVLKDELLSAPQEQALAVIASLLKSRPEVAPSIVRFACPDLTYAPVRGIYERRSVGTLKSFSSKSGFGFIACAELLQVFGADVFVHVKQMGPYAEMLVPGTPVTFAVALCKENKPRAYDIQPMDGLLMEAPQHITPDGGEAFGMAPVPGAPFGLPGPASGYSGCGAKRKWQDAGPELGCFRGRHPKKQKLENISEGRIKSFSSQKGFGFIVCEELVGQGFIQDVFLLAKHTQQEWQAGQIVTFKAFLNDKGQPQAKDVELFSYASRA